MVKQYDNGNTSEQKLYLDYIKNALDKRYNRANGKTPNAVASGLGMAFLYRTTHQEKYKKACEKIYSDYG
jgi:unsaturated rhamnogalacturonyl hydrolase